MAEYQKAPEFACPLCDSDIPTDSDVKQGEIHYCSYCEVGLRVVKGKGGKLTLEFEEEE